MYSCKLILGDYWNDGHGQHEMINLISNVPKEEVEQAYEVGSVILGFDFANKCCENYEENTISEATYIKLKEAGINVDGLSAWDDEYTLDADTFARIIVDIIKLGNDSIELEIVPPDVIPALRLNGQNQFGYGLFSN